MQALEDTGESGRRPRVRSVPEPEISRRVNEATGEEVPRGCPDGADRRAGAVPEAEGRDPAAAVLVAEAEDVVEDEDMLRKAREGAGGERTRGSERRPAESERCSVM